MDKYEDSEKKNDENSKLEKNIVDTDKIIKKLKEKDFSPIDSMINVHSTRAEEKKRASDKSLVYNDAVQINSNINDCITRLKASENGDFEKLNEATEELEKSRKNIDKLIELLKSKI